MPRRLLASLLAVATIAPLPGCYGSFAATRRLWHWNRGFEGRWGREGVYLATGVLTPVYGLAAVGDAVVFNSVEFWSGSNVFDLPAGDHALEARLGASRVDDGAARTE